MGLTSTPISALSTGEDVGWIYASRENPIEAFVDERVAYGTEISRRAS